MRYFGKKDGKSKPQVAQRSFKNAVFKVEKRRKNKNKKSTSTNMGGLYFFVYIMIGSIMGKSHASPMKRRTKSAQ